MQTPWDEVLESCSNGVSTEVTTRFIENRAGLSSARSFCVELVKLSKTLFQLCAFHVHKAPPGAAVSATTSHNAKSTLWRACTQTTALTRSRLGKWAVNSSLWPLLQCQQRCDKRKTMEKCVLSVLRAHVSGESVVSGFLECEDSRPR